MQTHKQFVAELLTDPATRAAYDALAPEYEALDALRRARQAAGLSQAEVARRMGTKPPAIARLESPSPRHSPSLRTLQRYAAALGQRVKVELVPASRGASTTSAGFLMDRRRITASTTGRGLSRPSSMKRK